MLQREVNNHIFTSAMEDGSQTAEIRALLASMYMQREFAHGLPVKVAMEIYQTMSDILHADNKKNEVKQQEIAVLIHNLQVRAANVINIDNLLGLACIYFTLPGEDPAAWDGHLDKKKIDIMKSGTSEDIVFFCTKACEYTPQLKAQLDTDFQDYLNKTEDLIQSQKPLTRTQTT